MSSSATDVAVHTYTDLSLSMNGEAENTEPVPPTS